MIIALSIAGPLFCGAQNLAASKVPAAVKAGLNKAHPGVTPAWEREDANYEANFKEGNKSVSVVIDGQGTIVETETPVALKSLPVAAQTYIQDHFNGKKLQEIAKIVKASGEVNYEVMVDHKDHLFDANGKTIIKKEKKEKD